MTNNDPKGPVARVFGLRTKTPQLPSVSDDERHEELISQAISGTRQLRKELAEWRQKAEQLDAEFSAFKQDTTHELLTTKHEHDAKSGMLRAKIAALDEQLQQTGRKLEHFERLSYELGTKAEDIEKFYVQELRNIRDAGQHAMLGLIGGVSNATINLNEAAKHASEGLSKQVENSANNMVKFIDDIRVKRQTGEYRQKPKPLGMEEEKQLSAEAEQKLAKLVERLKPENEPQEKDPPIPEFLKKQE